MLRGAGIRPDPIAGLVRRPLGSRFSTMAARYGSSEIDIRKIIIREVGPQPGPDNPAKLHYGHMVGDLQDPPCTFLDQ